jgi:hypothetical protein
MVEVIKLRRVECRGQLIAVARVKIGPITIGGNPILRSGCPDRRTAIALPQVPVRRRADGSRSG